MKIKSVLSLLLAATLVLGAAGTVYGEEPLKWFDKEYSEEYKEYLKDPDNPKWGCVVPDMYDRPPSETTDWLGTDYQEAMNRTTIRLKGKAETNSVKITFNLSKYADGSRVYMAESKTGPYKRVKTLDGGVDSYTIRNLDPNKKYYIKVRYYYWDEIDEKKYFSNYSNVLTIKTGTTLQVKAGKRQAAIKIGKVKGADGYRVYMAESKTGKFTRIKTLKGRKNTVYTKKKLKTGKTYYFKVRAYKWKDGKMKWDSYSTVKKITV